MTKNVASWNNLALNIYGFKIFIKIVHCPLTSLNGKKAGLEERWLQNLLEAAAIAPAAAVAAAGVAAVAMVVLVAAASASVASMSDSLVVGKVDLL